MIRPDPNPPAHWSPPKTTHYEEPRRTRNPKWKPKIQEKIGPEERLALAMEKLAASNDRFELTAMEEMAELEKQLMVLEEKILKGNKLLVALLTGQDPSITRAQALEYFHQTKAIHGAPTKK